MLICGHDAPPFGAPLCVHLRATEEPLSYVRWYTGRGMEFELLCMACVESREEANQIEVATLCQECFEHAAHDVHDRVDFRGAPGIIIRDEPIDDALARTQLPAEIGAILDFAPIDGASHSSWLLLTDESLIRFDADTSQSSRVSRNPCRPDPPPADPDPTKPRVRLHVSDDGHFAAIVTDYGRLGEIIDLRQDRVTLRLDGGDYYQNTVPFSFAFAQLNGRTVAIHRSLWNRLDISDPATGALISERPSDHNDESEHHLDYFHGELLVGPQGTFIFDDGWVWHPAGVPTIWSLERWLNQNVWESEDGPTRRQLDARAHYWPMSGCWLDERRFVLGGLGEDDEAMLDGVRVFDVTAGDATECPELMEFFGPRGYLFSDGTALYSADDKGLSRWSLSDGARTGHIAGFSPTRQHRGAGELAQLEGMTLIRWRCGPSTAR